MKISLILVTLLIACGGTSSDMSHQRSAPQPSPQSNPVPEVCGPVEQKSDMIQGSQWQLVWADEFDSKAIDGSKCQYETNCAGGGNNELQCYVEDDANAFIAERQLHIVALNQAVTGDSGWFGNSGNVVSRGYSSARLHTLETATKPRVVGYLPGYKGLTESIKNVDLHNLTHLNLSFANPNAEGDFLLNENLLCMPGYSTEHVKGDEIREVVERAHQAGVQVLMSLAGGVIPSCSGDWHRLLQSENRPQLVSKLINLMTDLNLDGLDIDLEGILLTQIDNAGNYTPFIQALSAQLKPQGKLLTSATASYEGGMIPIDSISYFDFVNIMSYDAIGPSWGQAGIEHSTYQQAVQDVQLWLHRGLTKQQLVLGLPFYGYGFGQYRSDYAIKDLVALYGSDILQQDVMGNLCAGCDYITYNGLVTLQAKTELALKHGSGVMIWELSHDSSRTSNILATIASQVAAPKTL